MSKKIAVILLNLGTPDSKKAIEPFLMNFFMDKNIISAPLPIRFMLAKYISKKRSKREAGVSYNELKNKSPLLKNCKKQALALGEILNDNNNNNNEDYEDKNLYKIFVSMRYWHPMSKQVLQDVRLWQADEIILLPLYPQYSITTTGSSFEDWKKSAKDLGYQVKTHFIKDYYDNEKYIKSSANNICTYYKKALKDGYKTPRILFSAHGLPEKVIKNGDPYQYQCEQSAQKIALLVAEKLDIADLDWQICYQSKVGRLKWIKPSIDDALDQASKDRKAVIIYPHAFTQEHVETLVELDIEYKKIADEKNIKGYYRVGTLGTSEIFITGLADLIKEKINE